MAADEPDGTPRIFDYSDYRKFLDDYYRHAKEHFGYFSYRWFARKAGYTSSGFYANIVKGIKNLTARYVQGFIGALGLSDREADYFRLMIEYDRSRSGSARQEVYEKMITLLPKKTRRLLDAHREFYSQWHHAVVLQTLNVLDIGDNVKDLCAWIVPGIGIKNARESIRLLEALGLISRDGGGHWRPTQLDLVGGREVGKLYIRDFQLAMLDKAREALPVIEPGRRYYITETCSVSRNCSRRIHEKAREFHKQVVDLIVNDGEPAEEVLQMNMQLFPMLREKEK